MKKGLIKKIYAYTACVICLVAGIIFLCVAIYGTIRIAAPGFTLSRWEWEKVATFQSFKTDWEKTEGALQLPDDELRIRWEDKREVAIAKERREGWQNLIQNLICLLVVTPLFIIHWRLARRMPDE
jgi:hypothetical protein